MTSSPAPRSRVSALMAAIPLAKAQAVSAPSSLAICSSTRERVGLPLRV
jgi:hypothetical protein